MRIDPLEVVMYLIGILCVALLILIPFAVAEKYKESKRLQTEMQADNCKLISEAKTGKTIYCGKACWRHEIKKEYSCTSGNRIIIQ